MSFASPKGETRVYMARVELVRIRAPWENLQGAVLHGVVGAGDVVTLSVDLGNADLLALWSWVVDEQDARLRVALWSLQEVAEFFRENAVTVGISATPIYPDPEAGTLERWEFRVVPAGKPIGEALV